MKPQPRFLRAWFALFVGLVVVVTSWFFFSGKQPPLSPMESRLVGDWSQDPPELIRSFHRDRTFATSDGQFVGVWRIENGRLMLTYWQRFELPHEYSLVGVARSLRRMRKETLSWEISFAEDGRQHRLRVPVDEDRPKGECVLRRVGLD